MKGFLAAHEQVLRKTHDLDELGRKCEHIDPSLTSILTTARDLTVFAWEFRYPGNTEIPPESEARETLATAQSVFDEILSRLPDNVRP